MCEASDALTVEAILVQVLLELVGTETGVLVHPKVSQAFCRVLGVGVLHPLWIDKGWVRVTVPTRGLLPLLYLLVHHPHLQVWHPPIQECWSDRKSE